MKTTTKTIKVVAAILAATLTTGVYAKGGGGGTAKPPPVAPPPPPSVIPIPPPAFAPGSLALTSGLTFPSAFDITGYIQETKVEDNSVLCPTIVPADPMAPQPSQGGYVKVNGVTYTIPCNTILQMPAASLTWPEFVRLNPNLPDGGNKHHNDLDDDLSVDRYAPTELQLVGNYVNGVPIAGLVYVSQESLNGGQGYIADFDYAHGIMYVAHNLTETDKKKMVRVRINDPVVNASGGRFSIGIDSTTDGKPNDDRYSVDNENPTIHSSSGYPMCIPRTDPSVADDPLCPQKNRPKVAAGCRNFRTAGVIFPTGRELAVPPATQTYCTGFVMEDPTSLLPGILGSLDPVLVAVHPVSVDPKHPDANQQAPFEKGDFVAYSGNLTPTDSLTGLGSDGNEGTYFLAHTIEANVGIFTQPGTLPVYLSIGGFGVGADTTATAVNGAPQEAQNRIFLEASVTDVKSIVDIYLVDINPATGAQSNRWITPPSMTGELAGVNIAGVNNLVGGGIITQFTGPQPGRARIRATKATPGILISPTRNIRVVARSLCAPEVFNNAAVGNACLQRKPAANGLFTGQYMAPVFEYIFPENVVAGDPIVTNNFWDLGFLENGEGPGTGPLMPKPW
jgi:hypothetical protein